MKTTGSVVGVRALKARSSAYLRDVSQGGTVTIGDRRRQPVARLVPFLRSADRDVLDRLAARGVIQRGSGKPGRGPRVKPRPGSRRVADLVVEDRG
jgi:antitoxin (DNA-binding transcriptional repressor) of toxin-antitoxin stability system